jgi:hypothetical protein
MREFGNDEIIAMEQYVPPARERQRVLAEVVAYRVKINGQWVVFRPDDVQLVFPGDV